MLRLERDTYVVNGQKTKLKGKKQRMSIPPPSPLTRPPLAWSQPWIARPVGHEIAHPVRTSFYFSPKKWRFWERCNAFGGAHFFFCLR